jgi:hypothetical protein
MLIESSCSDEEGPNGVSSSGTFHRSDEVEEYWSFIYDTSRSDGLTRLGVTLFAMVEWAQKEQSLDVSHPAT